VEWERRDADVARLTELLGPDLAASVTDAETHHGDGPRTPLAGEVMSIRAVFAGPGPLAEREVGDAAEHSASQERGQAFAGYLVELRAR
jgi:hypothetical protein